VGGYGQPCSHFLDPEITLTGLSLGAHLFPPIVERMRGSEPENGQGRFT
jgi:hypothetical protein